MLGKLLKYEIPAVARRLLPLYAALAAVSVFLGLNFRGELRNYNMNVITVIAGMLFAAVMTAVFVVSVIVMIQRYNDNILGDGGYFSLSLPVSEDLHLLNKTISAGIWYAIGAVGVIVAGLLVTVTSGSDVLRDILRFMFVELDTPIRVVIGFIEILIMAFIGGCKAGLQVYTAITIGHQAKRHIALAGLAVYIATITAEILLMDLLEKVGLLDVLGRMTAGFSEWGMWNFMFVMVVIAGLIAAAIYYLICRWYLKNSLNLA